MNVARASHEYAVQLIRETTNELVLRVLTVTCPSLETQPACDNTSYADGKAG